MAGFRRRVLAALDDIFGFTSARRSVSSIDLVSPVQTTLDIGSIAKLGSRGLFDSNSTRVFLDFAVDGTAGAGTYYGTGSVNPGSLQSNSKIANLDTDDWDLWLIGITHYVDVSTGAYASTAISLPDSGGTTYPLARVANWYRMSAGSVFLGYGSSVFNIQPAIVMPVRIPWTSTVYTEFVCGAAATLHTEAAFEVVPHGVGSVIPG